MFALVVYIIVGDFWFRKKKVYFNKNHSDLNSKEF